MLLSAGRGNKLAHQPDKRSGVSIADSAIGRPATFKSRSPKKRKGLKVFGTSALRLKVRAIGRKPPDDFRINAAKPEGAPKKVLITLRVMLPQKPKVLELRTSHRV